MATSTQKELIKQIKSLELQKKLVKDMEAFVDNLKNQAKNEFITMGDTSTTHDGYNLHLRSDHVIEVEDQEKACNFLLTNGLEQFVIPERTVIHLRKVGEKVLLKEMKQMWGSPEEASKNFDGLIIITPRTTLVVRKQTQEVLDEHK